MKKYIILLSMLLCLSVALPEMTFAQAPRNQQTQTTTSRQSKTNAKADKTAKQTQSSTSQSRVKETTTKPAQSSSRVNQAASENKTTTTATTSKRGVGPQGQGATQSNSANTQTTPPGRGYTNDGHPQPQHAPKPGNSNPSPYFHPNEHGYGHQAHVPHRMHPVYYGGLPYYYVSGVYCMLFDGVYIICRPPVGVIIARAIWNSMRPVIVFHNNTIYYYDDGSYFLPNGGDEYVVVDPPIGARIAELPSNYEEIILDGNTYYKVENTYYKAVIVDGYLWYEVVGKTIN